MILMHALGRPGEMPHQAPYDDVVGEVKASLKRSIAEAEAAGLRQIVVDPGFGFGKTPRENLKLIKHLDEFATLGYPILVGISRKSTIGILLGKKGTPAAIEDRLYGTLGATAMAILQGATIVRTHDVRPTREMLHIVLETANA